MTTDCNILFYSDKLASFEYSDSHPFKPSRARHLMDLLNRYSLIFETNQKVLEPEPLDEELLYAVHDKKYISLLKQCNTGEFDISMLEAGIGTPDNPVVLGMYDFALAASGATHQGAMMLLNNEASFAFNPLGGFHHAGRNFAEGFCFINDIAIAIAECLKRGARVAYIDIDAHHGNGVQDAFYGSDQVLTISLHESGKSLYPWGGFENEEGIKDGTGYNVNIPLLAESDDEVYLYAFRELVPPLIEAFKPDIIFLEAGGDVHRDDPLTHLNLTSNGYRETLKMIKNFGKPVCATGGGGYDVYQTANLWATVWSVFCGVEPEDHFAGSVGGMMFGPETTSGSLDEPPFAIFGEEKNQCIDAINQVIMAVKGKIFPLHGIKV